MTTGRFVFFFLLAVGAASANFRSPDFDTLSIQRGQGIVDCSLRQFKCKNNKCVQLTWMCDGEDDCGDNSDETAPECKGHPLGNMLDMNMKSIQPMSIDDEPSTIPTMFLDLEVGESAISNATSKWPKELFNKKLDSSKIWQRLVVPDMERLNENNSIGSTFGDKNNNGYKQSAGNKIKETPTGIGSDGSKFNRDTEDESFVHFHSFEKTESRQKPMMPSWNTYQYNRRPWINTPWMKDTQGIAMSTSNSINGAFLELSDVDIQRETARANLALVQRMAELVSAEKDKVKAEIGKIEAEVEHLESEKERAVMETQKLETEKEMMEARIISGGARSKDR